MSVNLFFCLTWSGSYRHLKASWSTTALWGLDVVGSRFVLFLYFVARFLLVCLMFASVSSLSLLHPSEKQWKLQSINCSTETVSYQVFYRPYLTDPTLPFKGPKATCVRLFLFVLDFLICRFFIGLTRLQSVWSDRLELHNVFSQTNPGQCLGNWWSNRHFHYFYKF